VSLNCRDEFAQTVGRAAPAPVSGQGREAARDRTIARSSSSRDPSVSPPWLAGRAASGAALLSLALAPVPAGAAPPRAQGGFVALADACCRPARPAFCQCPPRHLKHRWVGVEGHGRWPSPDRHRRSASSAAPLVLAVTPAMLAQWSLRERGPLILTAPMRTVEQLPVPFALLEEGTLSIEPAPTDRSQPRPSRQLRDTIATCVAVVFALR
jgi:hypothetical protein